MAVQWLSHQTGLAARAGCSGGLQKRIKETKEEEGGILEKWVQEGMRICAGRGIRWRLRIRKGKAHGVGYKSV